MKGAVESGNQVEKINVSKEEFRNCMYNYMRPIYDVAARSGFVIGWCV